MVIRDPRPAVLVVDDDTSNRTAVAAVLAPLSLELVLANSGREALRELLHREFALILLDVRMRDLDGFDTAALIRQRPRNRHTPIIFLTAYDPTEADLTRGYSLGAVDFIHLPIVPEVLRAKTAVFVELFDKTQELLTLYADAKEASRVKSEFLNMAAHELRTPLSVVMGYVSMLEDGSLGAPPPEWTGVLDILAAKAGELGRIVESLLTTARLDRGSLPCVPATVDLRHAATEAALRAEGRRALLDAELTCDLPDKPVLVNADPEHVARILDNLVNNALSYCTRTPRVRITVGRAGRPHLTVEDNGVGIPPGREDAIFERFVRVEDGGIGPTPGIGLGLHISRALAEQYGGQLFLESSRPGRGCRFTLALPAALPQVGAQQPSGSLSTAPTSLATTGR